MKEYNSTEFEDQKKNMQLDFHSDAIHSDCCAVRTVMGLTLCKINK